MSSETESSHFSTAIVQDESVLIEYVTSFDGSTWFCIVYTAKRARTAVAEIKDE